MKTRLSTTIGLPFYITGACRWVKEYVYQNTMGAMASAYCNVMANEIIVSVTCESADDQWCEDRGSVIGNVPVDYTCFTDGKGVASRILCCAGKAIQ
jgi:hypothetical protein